MGLIETMAGQRIDVNAGVAAHPRECQSYDRPRMPRNPPPGGGMQAVGSSAETTLEIEPTVQFPLNHYKIITRFSVCFPQ